MNKCPLCQSILKVIHIKKHFSYDILYCLDCQFQFSNPMEDHSEAFYQQCSLYESRSKDDQAEIPSYDWRYSTCLKFCIAKPNQLLLDVGCGDGKFMALAQGKGFKVFGIDIDNRAIRFAKNVRNLEHVESGGWERIQNLKNWKDFDMITLFDTLEHVSFPSCLASTVFKLLKPGGLVCITVPKLVRYPRIFDIEADFPPHHFTLWTSNALNVLLRKAGFEEVHIIEKPLTAEDFLLHLVWRTKRFIRKLKKIQNDPHIGTLSTKKGLAPVKKSNLVKSVKGLMLFFSRVASWFFETFHLGRGHTLLVIAKKPKYEKSCSLTDSG